MAFSLTRRHACGLVLVSVVVVLWVGSSTFIQFILREEEFERPLFLTYYSTALFTVYLIPNIPLLIRAWRTRHQASYSPLELTSPSGSAGKGSVGDTNGSTLSMANLNGAASRDDDRFPPTHHRSHSNMSTETGGIDADDLAEIDDSSSVDVDFEESPTNGGAVSAMSRHDSADGDESASSICCGADSEQRLSVRETFKMALLFSPIWFVMNYTSNASLLFTSVSSNTILSTTSGPFTLVMCYFILKERLALRNVAGTLLVMTGVVLIAITDSNRSAGTRTESLSGDALAVFSAMCYAFYGTLMKRRVGDDSQIHMTLFFGFVGLINACVMWPLIPILGAFKLEFITPISGNVLAFMSINGFVAVVSDYLWARSVLLTGPLIATIGLSFTIPLAFVSDSIVQHKTYTVAYFIGSIVVFVGFFLVNLTHKRTLEESEQQNTMQRQQIENIVEEFDLPESDAENPSLDDLDEQGDSSSDARTSARRSSSMFKSSSDAPDSHSRERVHSNGSSHSIGTAVTQFTIN